MSEPCYTTHEISKFCDVYPTTVIHWIEEGKLKAFITPGGHRRVKRSDLIALMTKHNMPIPEELNTHDKFRVLAIDDRVATLNMIKTILEAHGGIDVEIAKSGFEAGILIAEWMPDAVLLDILMPDMDGYEVARRLRQSEDTKNTPIIAITAVTSEKEKKKMFAGGINDYLSKPFSSGELVEKVKKYI